MPKKNLLVAGAVVILLLIIGAVGFVMMSRSPQKSVDELSATKENVQNSSSVSTTKESIRGLLSVVKTLHAQLLILTTAAVALCILPTKKCEEIFQRKIQVESSWKVI